MPRLNQAGKDIRRVLEWLLNRDVPDSEIGSILGLSKATYSRRKDADDFPNYAELTALGEALDISPRVLQIAFGWRGADELILLTVDEAHQYMDQVGAEVFGVEGVRNYMEERWQGDSPLATAIRKLVSAVDPKASADVSDSGAA
jgi:transcriptional regulator with XRE-family HTH domain